MHGRTLGSNAGASRATTAAGAAPTDWNSAPRAPSLLRGLSPLTGGGNGTPRSSAPVETPNHLLDLLQRRAPDEFERIAPFLRRVTLTRGSVLSEPNERIPFVYFPEGCVASLIKTLSRGKRIEVGTAGVEGMAGLPVFLGAETAPILSLIQVPGRAQCMAADDVRRLASAGSGLHAILQRYAQYQFDQAAQSIACNWLHRIEQRCARWLLMTHDRVPGDQFDLTHEYLATMLGARRAGVSEVAEGLKEAGLIKYQRGKITIADRAGLERASCECYASDRADYKRLLAEP